MASKTTNPLHFEDLEPHRFEDLTRQLIYDLKEWSALEATGRAGGDEGYDTRAIERVTVELGDEETETEYTDRIWLVQCKREKSVTPKKIGRYIDECLSEKQEKIYGVIFVAPCNLSKKTRDTFYEKIREYKISECYLWGNGELEDLLFHPKNDHLLFAYFNFSLKIRQRTSKTKIRSKLSTKKKALKVFHGHENALIRDPDDTIYPYKDRIDDFDENRPWVVHRVTGHYYDGIKVETKRHFAYLSEDGVSFDFADAIDDSLQREDVWTEQMENYDERGKIHKFWSELPEGTAGWFSIESLIPYDRILAIDEDGDEWFSGPHVYVSFDERHEPPYVGMFISIETNGHKGRTISPKRENRIEYFPKEMRKNDES